MNGYDLSRVWFDWCFENPERIKPNHSALYFFCIEHCNRLGWKKKFGLPTNMAKEAIGIKSYGTYISTLNDLVDFGFIEMIEKSKNQYSSNIIALSKFDKALSKALDKATVKHTSKQVQSTHQSIDSIDKPLTNNKEPINIRKDKQVEVLQFFGFQETSQNINHQRLILAFFHVQNQKENLDYFITQFDSYKSYISIGENIKFRYSLFNFLGSQKEKFEDGKWQSENWELKAKPVTTSKMQY